MENREVVDINSWEEFEETWFEPEFRYVLTTDINLEGKVINKISDFYGVLDGNGHSINLGSKEEAPAILRENNGIIKNLNIKNSEVQTDQKAGSICVKNSKEGEIKNCHVSGVLESEGSIGGIVRENRGTIRKCGFDGTLKARSKIGGIAAVNGNKGVIKNCHTSGKIIGGFRTGGIAGENVSKIKSCHSEVTATNELGTNGALGGLVGRNYDSLHDSYFYGTIVREKRYFKDKEYDMEGLIVGINNEKVINCHCRNIEREIPLIGKNTGFTDDNSFKKTIEKIKETIIINKI